ncbi:hypothetical protein EJB05_48809 [Eragrostis curvula]|uniref:G protein gamma domain-containing protein n=1 Tax=Eragrostis curvula TaxID=38414 RepID=A0A5J9T2S8_9POAL|nr:hypothetical protein EJB05_48809 [Eragrostis curvula]
MGEAPRPRSPPQYPDLCGRRRLQLEVQILNREVGFLEQEIQGLERIQPVSRCCKDVNEFVGAKMDPLIPVYDSCNLCLACLLSLFFFRIMSLLSFTYEFYPFPVYFQKQKETGILQFLLVDQIKTVHMFFMLVLLLAQAQDAELRQLFLPRHAVLQLPKEAVVLRGSLRLQATLRPLPAAVRQLLFQQLRLPVLLPQLRLLLWFFLCRMRWLPRRLDAVPELPPAFMLQMPVVVLPGGASLLRRFVRWCPDGVAVPRVLLRLRVLLPQVQGRLPVPAVRS